MAVFHTGRTDFGIVRQTLQSSTVGGGFAHGGGDHLFGDSAGAEDLGVIPRHIHHGGLYAYRAGTAVHDGRDLAVHIVQHVPGGGGGRLARGVGRRGCQRHAGSVDNGPGNRVRGHTNANRVQPGRCAGGHDVFFPDHHGQRSGPKLLGHPVHGRRDLSGQLLKLLQAGNVNDQRVVLGAAFGLKDPKNSIGIQGVCRQAVNRLGGNAHHFAARQQPSGFGDVSGRAAQQLSLHTCRSNGRRSCPWTF